MKTVLTINQVTARHLRLPKNRAVLKLKKKNKIKEWEIKNSIFFSMKFNWWIEGGQCWWNEELYQQTKQNRKKEVFLLEHPIERNT